MTEESGHLDRCQTPNYTALLKQCNEAFKSASKELNEAREVAERAGLSVNVSIVDRSFPFVDEGSVVLQTTGGHSNTDHVVVSTGDPKNDRISELKRALQRRTRAMLPEHKGEDRWDQPRVPGGRRRRIAREKDMPMQPPPSGYVIFVGHMTTKVRHDRPNERHNQTQVIREISKIWKMDMSDTERDYYTIFCREAREEYDHQYKEFCATGQFRASTHFEKMDKVGPWVRMTYHEKNGLERELSSYDTVSFPLRPPEFDEEYRKREEESKKKRKLKDQAAAREE